MKKFFKITAIITCSISIFAVLFGLLYYMAVTADAKFDVSALPSETETIVIYGADGKKIEDYFCYGSVNGEFVSDNLKYAFISVEDKRFINHNGVDYIRILGAALNNIKAGRFAEGASTISQQLIKNTHLSREKTVSRKLKEIKLAKELEKKYSKDEIIAMYLDVLYFGGGIYGVVEASQVFFGKDYTELSLSECATLAGIVKSPNIYSPLKSYVNAVNRRNIVLDLMYNQGYIDSEECITAKSEEIFLANSGDDDSISVSYTASVLAEAAKILDISVANLRFGGYEIYTSYDKNAQNLLYNTLNNTDLSAENDYGNSPSAAAILVDNTNCKVKAYYSTEDNACQNLKRQIGSTIKPFLVYAPSIEYGIASPATRILDEKMDFGGYSPSNYGDKYYGNISVRYALKESLNIPAVKLLNAVGVDNAFMYAQKLNMNLNESDKNLNLALGGLTDGLSLDVLSGCYCCLANGGNYTPVSFIKSIVKNGSEIYSDNVKKITVFSPQTAYIVTDMLIDTANDGTAKGLKYLDFEVASKTGTVAVNGLNRDAYNITYTTSDTLAVWHGNYSGNAEYALVGSETGGAYTTKTASVILSDLYNNASPQNFEMPKGVRSCRLDKISLDNDSRILLARENIPDEYVETDLFLEKLSPEEYADTFDNFHIDNLKITDFEGNICISFNAKKHLLYDIIEKSIFGDYILKTIKNIDGAVSFERAADGETYSYSVVAYYIDKKGNRIEDLYDYYLLTGDGVVN